MALNHSVHALMVEGRVNDAASMMTDTPEWFSKREIVALLAMTVRHSVLS